MFHCLTGTINKTFFITELFFNHCHSQPTFYTHIDVMNGEIGHRNKKVFVPALNFISAVKLNILTPGSSVIDSASESAGLLLGIRLFSMLAIKKN